MSEPAQDFAFHRFDPSTTGGWKSYPVRLCGPRNSLCHARPTILTQVARGGFVTANCSQCGADEILTRNEFLSMQLWVGCPRCRRAMERDMVPLPNQHRAANYGLLCRACRIYFLFADILPDWSDVFPGPRS